MDSQNDLIERLRQLPESERDAYLEETVVDDTERKRLSAQLVEIEEANAFFGDDLSKQHGILGIKEPKSSDLTEQEGDQVGPYILRQQIGEGGFGTVWMAEQSEPISRMVALKVVKAGMDTKQVLARFEAERQALGMMDHTHIAKVLDAGATSTGRPYFAMELVKGIPITQFCREQKLSMKERLALFQDVCSAVNHAHQKGIIHRDLKPSNVMVTLEADKPIAKVIDFGIAKATQNKLTEKTLFTRFEQFLGTPVYMSPEQAAMSNLDIDTRSDIYSLGVLLYELLAGQPPFDAKTLLSAGYDEMRRMIKEDEPPKPSARLTQTQATASHADRTDPHITPKTLQGELDWIVMKAIEKDRSRRYETANAFAADIGRYLEDEPVQAAAPSALYSFRKFARRNKVAAAIALILVVATIVSTWLALIATEAKSLTESALQAEKIAINRIENELMRSRVREGNAWLERAQIYSKMIPPQGFNAALMAGQAIGYEGYGRDHQADGFAEKYPVFFAKQTEGYLKAKELIKNHSRAVRPIWSSPASWHHQDMVTSVAFSPDGKTLVSGSGDNTIKLWDLQSGELGHTLSGHQARVWSVAISPDGKTLASASRDNTIKLWDLHSGEQRHTLSGHQGEVISVAFSADGKTLASGSGDRTIKLWDPHSGEQRHTLSGHQEPVFSVAFSPDGKTLASGSGDNTIKLWDPHSGEQRHTLSGHQGLVSSVAFSPDGKTLASGSSYRKIKLWDLQSGEQRHTLSGHQAEVISVAFSPDGKTLASGSGDNTIKLWDPQSGEQRHTLSGHHGWVTSVAFSPDGKTLASGSGDNTIKLVDPHSGEPRHTLSGHQGEVTSVAISPDGKTLASGSGDSTIKLWDLQSGELGHTLSGHQKTVFSVAFSPDGKTLASGSRDNTIKLWDPQSGELRHTLSGHQKPVMSVAFSPDGKILASGGIDETIKLWDPHSGDLRDTLSGHGGRVMSVAFSADGKTLASASRDNTIKLWDPHSRELRDILHGHQGEVTSVAFSPDGKTLASGSGDNTTKLWDLQSGELRHNLSGHQREVTSVAYSPDGKTLASASSDNTIKLWEPHSGELGHTLSRHHLEVTTRRASFYLSKETDRVVAFSADGKTLASGSRDNTIKLWDLQSGEPRHTLSGHQGEVTSVAYSPDGKTLASGSWDHTIKRWDLHSGELGHTLSGHGGRVMSVAYSPDGKTLASASRDNTIKLWEPQSGEQRHTLSGHQEAVFSVAYSPDGKTLASGSGDNTIKLWDLQSREQRDTLSGHGGRVTSVAFSPDGKTLASGSGDHTIKLWDLHSGVLRHTLSGHQEPVFSVAFSPDGKTLASGSRDKTIKLWDPHSGELRHTLSGHQEAFNSVAISPDGNTLASASGDNTIKLWDLHSGELRHTLSGHQVSPVNSVWSVAFSSDGKTLASASRDTTIKLWNTTTQFTELADHLSKGWLMTDGRHISWLATTDNLYKSKSFEYLNVSRSSHIALIRQKKNGKSETEIDQELFWAYFRAKNWNSAMVMFPSLDDPSVRDRAIRSFIQWLETESISKEVASFRLDQLKSIATDSTWNAESIKKLWRITSTELVSSNSTWNWLHPTNGMDPATEDEDFHATFHQLHYDDSSWESGQDSAGGFGYGDQVGISIGEPEAGKRYTAYFRHRFSTTEAMQSLVLTMQRDDGVIVYLDGEEILRDNMPEGPEAYSLLAKDRDSGTGETILQTFRLEHALDPGEHVLAISLHNQSPTSSDLRIAEIELHGLPKEDEPAK